MHANSNPPTKFVADSTLGKLAKYLRLAGFDTVWDSQKPDGRRLAAISGGKRVVLTRSTAVSDGLASVPSIFIKHNRPTDQMRQVLSVLGLRIDQFKPLTRCALCNKTLDEVSKLDISHKVPPYIWQHHRSFKFCPGCDRVYWSGSHTERWMEMISQWIMDPVERNQKINNAGMPIKISRHATRPGDCKKE